MSNEATYFDTDTELDLSGEGLQTTTCRWDITGVEVEEHEHGQRYIITFEPEEEIEDLPGGTVQERGYLKYDGPSEYDLAKIGRGILKRIMQAALGTPKAPLNALVGTTVTATVKEDDMGFANLGRFKKA